MDLDVRQHFPAASAQKDNDYGGSNDTSSYDTRSYDTSSNSTNTSANYDSRLYDSNYNDIDVDNDANNNNNNNQHDHNDLNDDTLGQLWSSSNSCQWLRDVCFESTIRPIHALAVEDWRRRHLRVQCRLRPSARYKSDGHDEMHWAAINTWSAAIGSDVVSAVCSNLRVHNADDNDFDFDFVDCNDSCTFSDNDSKSKLATTSLFLWLKRHLCPANNNEASREINNGLDQLI